jgi:hypothetical protein
MIVYSRSPSNKHVQIGLQKVTYPKSAVNVIFFTSEKVEVLVDPDYK